MSNNYTYKFLKFLWSKNAEGQNRYFTVNELGLFLSVDGTGDNLCSNAIATSSGQYNAQTGPEKAIDGLNNTYYESNESINHPNKHLTIELDQPAAVRSFRILSIQYTNERPVAFTVLGSIDGESWDVIYITEAFNKHNFQPQRVLFGIKGFSKLENNQPSSMVLIYSWGTKELIAKLTPNALTFNWLYTLEEEVLVTHIGPAGFRPISDGPISPGDLTAN